MNSFNTTSSSSNYTMKIAKEIAKYTSKGDIIILTGELGCGKTKFVEGFLSYYGLENEISSPTFNIVNQYSTPTINLYHFDVYRLSDIDEFYAIGGEEYFIKGICLIEWGELIKEALPFEYIEIKFQKIPNQDNSRILSFKALGKKYENILNSLKEDLT